jgi:hypothetical protein
MHALSGIRTQDPSFRANEDGSCLRLRGHCDRHLSGRLILKVVVEVIYFMFLIVLSLFAEGGIQYWKECLYLGNDSI